MSISLRKLTRVTFPSHLNISLGLPPPQHMYLIFVTFFTPAYFYV